MPRSAHVAIVLLVALVLFACASVPLKPGDQCHGAALVDNQWATVVLTVMVQGIKASAVTNPVDYAMAKASAQELVNVLESKPVSIENIAGMNLVATVMVNTLATLLPAGQVIHPCDAKILAAYLRMI